MEWRGSCAIHGWVSSSSSQCPRCADAAEITRLRGLVVGGGLPPFPQDQADRRRVAEKVARAVREMCSSTKLISGAIRDSLHTHPDVGAYFVGSATKRVAGQIAGLDLAPIIDKLLAEMEEG